MEKDINHSRKMVTLMSLAPILLLISIDYKDVRNLLYLKDENLDKQYGETLADLWVLYMGTDPGKKLMQKIHDEQKPLSPKTLNLYNENTVDFFIKGYGVYYQYKMILETDHKQGESFRQLLENGALSALNKLTGEIDQISTDTIKVIEQIDQEAEVLDFSVLEMLIDQI